MTAITVAPTEAAPPESQPWRRALRRLVKRRGAMVGAFVVLFFVAVAIFAPLISPYDPIATNWLLVRKPPSAAHWFGTDEIGRDVLARIIYGARASLLAGVVSVCISLVCGVPIGLLAGYVGGFLDGLLMRITDAMLACPFLILAIALAAFLGPSLTNAMIAVGISVVPFYARVTYAIVLAERQKTYVDAAQVIGARHARVIVRHLLPNVMPPMIVVASLGFSAAVLSAAALSFLGLGAQPPAAEWGSMLATGRNYIQRAPWVVIAPGMTIFIAVMAFNLLGDGIRDILDPRQRDSIR